MKCKYVAKYARKGDAKRHARDLHASGFRARVRKIKGGVEVLACGKRRR